jgi:transposase InsO family protein
MDEYRGQFSLDTMSKILKISPNSYYSWKRRGMISNVKTNHLKSRIKDLFNENKEIYGAPRIHELLKREGINISLCYVGKLMRGLGLRSILSKKFVVTTDSKHNYPVSRNVLNREFRAAQTGKKWVSDISYIKVGSNWNYLTTIIDLADRKVVGWSVSKGMKVEETIWEAWNQARSKRKIKAGFIFHSDRGVQYAANTMNNILSFNKKVTQSMSRKGNCWDNAVAESFFKSIKYEWINRFNFDTTEQLSVAVEEYIQWYNTKRIHSTLGYKSPLEKQIELDYKNYKNVA